MTMGSINGIIHLAMVIPAYADGCALLVLMAAEASAVGKFGKF